MTENAWIALFIVVGLALVIISSHIRDTLIAKYRSRECSCDCGEDEETEETSA